jgi:hypothetical protein
VQDIRDGRHMQQEWIIIHTNFIMDHRNRITEQAIQKKLIDKMIVSTFPYIHRGPWNTIQFWADVGGRHSYPLNTQNNSPKHSTPTSPKTNPSNAANTLELPHMSAFEKLLTDNAAIIALTKTPDASTTSNRTTTPSPPTTNRTSRRSYDSYEPGVEESKEEPLDPVKQAYKNFSQEMTTTSPTTLDQRTRTPTHHMQSTSNEPSTVNKYHAKQSDDAVQPADDTNSSISTSSGSDMDRHTTRPKPPDHTKNGPLRAST